LQIVTKEEFDSFRIDPNYLAGRRQPNLMSGAANSPATSSYVTKQSPSLADCSRREFDVTKAYFPNTFCICLIAVDVNPDG
jgi:hypothetical protein